MGYGMVYTMDVKKREGRGVGFGFGSGLDQEELCLIFR